MALLTTSTMTPLISVASDLSQTTALGSLTFFLFLTTVSVILLKCELDYYAPLCTYTRNNNRRMLGVACRLLEQALSLHSCHHTMSHALPVPTLRPCTQMTSTNLWLPSSLMLNDPSSVFAASCAAFSSLHPAQW